MQENVSSFVNAASSGDFTKIKTFIKYGKIDVNTLHSSKGESALHKAVFYAHDEIVEYLIDIQADINVLSRKAQVTPLHFSVSNKSKATLKTMALLVEAGADINIQAEDGSTVLHHCCENGYLEKGAYLIEYKADLAIKKKDGHTALHLSCSRGDLEICSALLKHNAPINATSNYNITPLHIACRNNHLEVVKLLVDAGAFLTIKNKAGYVPLDTARRGGHERIMDWLSNAQASQTKKQIQLVSSIEMLTRGQTLKKFGRKGRPHDRTFRINPEGTKIYWVVKYTDPESSGLELAQVTSIERGRSTYVFLRYKKTATPEQATRSFSLMYGKNRSLDIECTTREQCDMWLLTLQYLITQLGMADARRTSLSNYSVSDSHMIDIADADSELSFSLDTSPGDIVLSGWLQKKNRTLDTFGTYRKRYFTLRTGGNLYYYGTDVVKSPRSKPKGIIPMSTVREITRLSGKRRKYIVQVLTKSREYILVAKDEHDQSMWVDGLNKALLDVVGEQKEEAPLGLEDKPRSKAPTKMKAALLQPQKQRKREAVDKQAVYKQAGDKQAEDKQAEHKQPETTEEIIQKKEESKTLEAEKNVQQERVDEQAGGENLPQVEVVQDMVVEDGAQKEFLQEDVENEEVGQEENAQEDIAKEEVVQEEVVQEGVAQENAAQEAVGEGVDQQEDMAQENAAQKEVAREDVAGDENSPESVEPHELDDKSPSELQEQSANQKVQEVYEVQERKEDCTGGSLGTDVDANNGAETEVEIVVGEVAESSSQIDSGAPAASDESGELPSPKRQTRGKQGHGHRYHTFNECFGCEVPNCVVQ